MRTKLIIIAATFMVSASAPSLAAGNAAQGLQDLRELNLTVFGTLTTNGHEVEGKTFAGTLNASNNTNFGIGSNANPGQGAASSTFDVLGVVNDASGSWRLKAGSSNGGNGVVGSVARIGGNVGNVDFNDANGYVGALVVGNSLTGSINVNGHSVTYGGSGGGISSAVYDATLATGGANDVHAIQLGRLATLQADLTALSDTLTAMTSLATINDTASALNYSGATGKFAVFTMTAAAFGNSNSNFDNLFTNVPNGYTTIINVLGTSLVENGNVNSQALNQSVIWNFNAATSLTLKGFHGSVLAPYAAVSNSSAIEGSIVAKSFTLNGEVHLGTYAGVPLPPSVPSVPEPASWAMLLCGFALVGGVMRSQRKASVSFS